MRGPDQEEDQTGQGEHGGGTADPAEGAEAMAASKNSVSLISPAARRRRLFQMTVPAPTSSPSNQPSSIGPPERTIAGMSTVAAAMIDAGVVLSQPVVSTTASIG